MLGLAGSVNFFTMEDNSMSAYDVPQGKIRKLLHSRGYMANGGVIVASGDEILARKKENHWKALSKMSTNCYPPLIRIPLSSVSLEVMQKTKVSAFAYNTEVNI